MKPRRLHILLMLTAAMTLAARHSPATGDFYERPLQTLSDYLKLDQLSAKSFQQIEDETRKPPAEGAKINYKAELEALPKMTGAEALASIDKMIAAARADGANPLLNLLNDVRDLFSGPAQALESIAYLKWRLNHATEFGVEWEKNRKKLDAPTDEAAPAPGKDSDKEIDEELAKASPAMKPHWLYLEGAALFLEHAVADSQTYFLKLVKDYPKHPRAEFGLFMAARCQLWKSRSQEYTQQDMKLVAAERPRAKKLFEEFLAKYPHGRLYGDALGWYGAFAYDGHDFATALRCYVQQAEMTDHPELYASACEMVEKTLSHLASAPRDKAFAEVAKNPRGAQALVYLIINTSESDNYDGKLDTIEEVRGWRKNVLPRLGAAIAAEAKLYQNAEWKPRHLAMLALAASGGGQHEQALKLLGTAGDAVLESDDLLFARGVVFHRAKKPGEAAVALRALLEKFPDSPLAGGARLRLGLALADNHEGGEAVLALNKLIPKKAPVENKADAAPPADEKKPDADANAPAAADDAETEDYPEESPLLYRLNVDQVRALIDTLLNFAPIEELAAAARTPGLDPVLRLQLTEPIAERLLAREQFDEARKFMTPAQFDLMAGPLVKLTRAADEAKDPAARASACLKLGDAWSAARGKLLTFPLDTDEARRAAYIDFSADADVRRAESAPFIGAVGNYKAELESRDELRHAFKWWLDASDAQPGTALTAQALWRALNAMPRIADVSPFTYERALARKWGETAKKLYDRLRSECADSPEAKRFAVAWDFPAPPKRKPEDDYPIHRPPAGDFLSGSEALKIEQDAYGGGPETEGLNKELAAFQASAAESSLEALKARTKKLQARVRKGFPGAFDARWVNLIDDLDLFLSEPDPGEEVRKRYLELRFQFVNQSAIGGGNFMDEQDKADPDKKLQEVIKVELADPKNKPVADYYEFLNLAVIANHFIFVKLDWKDKNGDPDTYRSRDYPALAKGARAFLEKHPKSKKREAAMLLYARAAYRASEDIALRKPVTWPQAARWEGGYEVTYSRQEPFDARRVLGALDDYDRAFPKGRYAADIRAYRGAVAMRLHDWKTALALTTAQLDDHADPSLDGETADRLGNIFTELRDERYRADILTAVKAAPSAKKLLQEYLAFQPEEYENKAHPLHYMKAWLRGELAR